MGPVPIHYIVIGYPQQMVQMAFYDLSHTFHKQATNVSQHVFVILLWGILTSRPKIPYSNDIWDIPETLSFEIMEIWTPTRLWVFCYLYTPSYFNIKCLIKYYDRNDISLDQSHFSVYYLYSTDLYIEPWVNVTFPYTSQT